MKLVVVAYAVALAALPFGHHDLVCHLKSNTHCTTCLVGTSVDDSGAEPPLATLTLDDAGQPVERPRPGIASCAPAPSSGRAPPVAAEHIIQL